MDIPDSMDSIKIFQQCRLDNTNLIKRCKYRANIFNVQVFVQTPKVEVKKYTKSKVEENSHIFLFSKHEKDEQFIISINFFYLPFARTMK